MTTSLVNDVRAVQESVEVIWNVYVGSALMYPHSDHHGSDVPEKDYALPLLLWIDVEAHPCPLRAGLDTRLPCLRQVECLSASAAANTSAPLPGPSQADAHDNLTMLRVVPSQRGAEALAG